MDIFVYGTLRSPSLLRAVIGADQRTTPARLHGFAVHRIASDCVPIIAPDEEAGVNGLLLHDVKPEAKDRLDYYESAFGYTISEMTVVSEGEDMQALVYRPPAEFGPHIGAWLLRDWQKDHEMAAVLAATELFSISPRLKPEELRLRWPMMERRAWAKVRASKRAAPATKRRNAGAKDFRIISKGLQGGKFYALQGVEVAHRKFDGATTPVLPREVFVGIDAALVLPYDAVSDRVVLVEQVRMGPGVLGDPNPWVLEPVAGMVDARETPEDAARREAREEAGLTNIKLEQIASFYASPGSSTDYFHAYLGLCRLPDDGPYHGGVAEENEDIRLHPLSFDAAMALARSGEITAGPLLMMLYWLAGERSRLRAAAA